jgi:cytoskeletal protein CcmA (bactofilin family)
MPWGSKKAGARGAEIENVLGRSAVVHGDLKSEGAFRIDGTVEGQVESRSSIVVGESGTVRGEVRGSDVVIAGHVFGNVVASGHLEVVATGTIEGDIEAQSVSIETGGVFRGMSRMGGKAADGKDRVSSTHLTSVR